MPTPIGGVDRGGLRYPIEVVDRFSNPLKEFTRDVRTAKDAFRTFKKNVNGLGAGARAVATNLEKINRASRQFVGPTLQAVRASRARQISADREARALERLARAQQQSVGQISAQATRQVSSALNEQARALTAVAGGWERLSRAIERADRAARRAATATRTLGTAQQTTARQVRTGRREMDFFEGSVSRAVFTFRRLVGVLAVFTVARRAADGFRTLITETIDFSRKLEDAQLGVASLFTAVGQVRSPTGELLFGVEALNEGLKISEDQLKKLRVESLRTAATFDQVAEAFQVALAPGLTGGLDVDQIRKFTVQISQAAAAISVPQNQLAEEIRSILEGTIQKRTTRIAVALGIDNEDIRQAREAGTLFEFLQKRFEAFSIASAKALDNFSARFTNARDAILLVTSAGALEFFEQLKELLKDVSESFVSLNSDNNLVVNERVVKLSREFFGILQAMTTEARAFGRALDLAGVSQVFRALTTIGRVVVSSLATVFEGFTRGAADVAQIFNALFGDVTRISGEDGLGKVLRLMSEILVLSIAWRAVAGSIKTIFTTIAKSPLLRIVTLLAIAAGLANELGQELSGTTANLTLEEKLRSFAINVKAAVNELGLRTKYFLEGVFDSLIRKVAQTIAEFTGSVGSVSQALADYLLGSNNALVVALREYERINRDIELGYYGAAQAEARYTELAVNGSKQRRRELEKELRALDNATQAELDRVTAPAKRRSANLQSGVDANKAAETVSDIFERGLGPTIAKAIQFARGELVSAGLTFGDTVKQGLNEAVDDLDQRLGTVGRKLGDAVSDSLVVPAITPEQQTRLDAAATRNNADRNVIQAQANLLGGGAQARQDLELAQSRAQVAAAKEQLAIIRTTNVERLNALDTELRATQEPQKQFAIRERLLDQQISFQTQSAQAETQLLATQQQQERLNQIAERPIQMGFQTALDNLDTSAFQATVQFVEQAIAQLSSTIASAILDSFLDPQKDIRESFGQLFKQLAQQLLTLLIQAIIVKSLTFAFGNSGGEVPLAAGSFNPGQGGGGNFTFGARGGQVPSRGRPSLAHYGRKAVGLAKGGPPPGVPASDTVPAWLTPGEFVMRLGAVRAYGADVLSAINDAAIDPGALRALAAPVRGRRRMLQTARIGYAEGGNVTPGPAQPAAGGITRAVLVPDEQTFDRLVRGGEGAFIGAIKRNKNAINSALR